jgi:hypothetical protein
MFSMALLVACTSQNDSRSEEGLSVGYVRALDSDYALFTIKNESSLPISLKGIRAKGYFQLDTNSHDFECAESADGKNWTRLVKPLADGDFAKDSLTIAAKTSAELILPAPIPEADTGMYCRVILRLDKHQPVISAPFMRPAQDTQIS